eukprot:TRINITY_DN2035_c0_g1_i10.p1 TRINITY_DN2035_c0_g1~~TRINITY_DN2035_c0_g1_i10.p1  ORF type:complete len:500 (-),score=99.13 TRINITY_DN2035_c0_g1_i10:3-1502(-)
MLTDFMNLFCARGLGVNLLKWALSAEIDNTSNPRDVFRGISVSTLMMEIVFEKVGKEFLNLSIGNTIREIIQSGKNYEVDTNRVDAKTAKKNSKHLIKFTQQIIDSLLENISNCPKVLRFLFNHIKDMVKAKFSGFWNVAVGSFVFLRFICTAIVFPETWDMVYEAPSLVSRRGLILVSKLLQNLSNNREFDGKKESYMVSMNTFIVDNKLKAFQILDGLSESGTDVRYRIAVRRISGNPSASESSELNYGSLNTQMRMLRKQRKRGRKNKGPNTNSNVHLYEVSEEEEEAAFQKIGEEFVLYSQAIISHMRENGSDSVGDFQLLLLYLKQNGYGPTKPERKKKKPIFKTLVFANKSENVCFFDESQHRRRKKIEESEGSSYSSGDNSVLELNKLVRFELRSPRLSSRRHVLPPETENEQLKAQIQKLESEMEENFTGDIGHYTMDRIKDKLSEDIMLEVFHKMNIKKEETIATITAKLDDLYHNSTLSIQDIYNKYKT